jgi:hypothetical protein
MPHHFVPSGYNFSFFAYFEDYPALVNVSYNHYGGGIWDVLLNRRYQGRVWHTVNFSWHHDISPKSPLCLEDICTIMEMITDAVGPPKIQ